MSLEKGLEYVYIKLRWGYEIMKLGKRNKLLFGVGINDTDYNVYEYENVDSKHKIVWQCPFYRTWMSMLARCYSEKFQSRQPTYKGCSVCEEWLTFSTFKKWMEQQDWENKQLDKDLLKEGNKIYSPEYCIFVDRKINTFVIDSGASRGEYLIGVCLYMQKDGIKFQSHCSNPFTRKLEYLGLFTNELDAHLVWKKRKHELACQLAESELVSDPRLAEVLKTRYI